MRFACPYISPRWIFAVLLLTGLLGFAWRPVKFFYLNQRMTSVCAAEDSSACAHYVAAMTHLTPLDPVPFLIIGDHLKRLSLRQKDPKEKRRSYWMAMAAYERVSQLQPANPEGKLRMAALSRESGNYIEAEKYAYDAVNTEERASAAQREKWRNELAGCENGEGVLCRFVAHEYQNGTAREKSIEKARSYFQKGCLAKEKDAISCAELRALNRQSVAREPASVK